MAPSQPLATDNEEGRPKIMVKSEETREDFNEKKDKVGLGLVCASNFEDNGLYGDSSAARNRVEDSALDREVDVVGFVDGEVIELEKSEDPDATEQSSSFGNTFSGSEDEVTMSSSDMDVDSQFSVENGEQPVSDGFSRLLKKKKVTDQWRVFINPLMWRCQWLELRMNELRSQASMYDKELAAYKREKQLQSKMIELDDSVSRLVPLACQSHKKRAMKRRKRKKAEDTVDISSYMSNHSIFSYCGENKRSETDCQSVDNDCGDQVDEVLTTEDYEWILLGLKGGDDSLEDILFNLDGLQSRILSLKTELSSVMCRNSIDISCTAANFLQGDRSLSLSPGTNGDVIPLVSENELEVPESAVSSYGDAADVDMIDCTGFHRHGKELYKDFNAATAANDVLIKNEAAEEELKTFGNAKLEEVLKEEAQSCSEDAKAPPSPTKAPSLAVPLKPCYTGKKRGRKPKKRKGGFAAGFKNDRIQKRRLN